VLLVSRQAPVSTKHDSPRNALLDLQLSGIVSAKMRHVIKRYLKRLGVTDVDVVHLLDGGELGMRLVAYGKLPPERPQNIGHKLDVLEEAVLETLSQKVDGLVPHPSRADSEWLRRRLSKEEPSMKRVFYKKA
jgi:hypothetical protein